MPRQRETILKQSLGYEILLIIVLSSITFMYIAGNLIVSEDITPWRVVISHAVLLLVGVVGMVYISLLRRGGTRVKETFFRFTIGTLLLALPPAFLSLANPAIDWMTNVQLIMFFTWCAFIENIVFYYAFPILLYMYGLSARRSWMLCVILWTVQHAFVWELQVASVIMGFVFGMMQAIVFEWTGSFLAICFSHGIWNAARMGVNFQWILIVIAVVIFAFMLRRIGERR